MVPGGVGMAITKLTVENFKSFDKLEVELRPFNIVVGSNASGKSNFLDVFRFLRDIADDSLESAIGIRGGGEALRNFNLDANEILRICVETDDIERHLVRIRQMSIDFFGMEHNRIIYELSIKFDESDTGFEVITDRVTEQVRQAISSAWPPGATNSLAYISTYDFDPRKAQQAVPPTGSQYLHPSAENLSVVLRDILRRPESNRRLINLVSELLPFVQDLAVEEFGFGHLITTLTERFSDKGYRLPAAFASDGTIACLALVIALYFQDSAVAIFEEPDRHIHPRLAGRVMQLMNEVTDDTQVIITTHNPELLRHANLEDILLVTRDNDGHSQVTRPANSEVVRHFLKSELGVEDLFTQDLLAL